MSPTLLFRLYCDVLLVNYVKPAFSISSRCPSLTFIRKGLL